MHGNEIDPGLVKSRLLPIRGAVAEFLRWCDDVEYVADNGYDARSVAIAEATKLQQRLEHLKRTL